MHAKRSSFWKNLAALPMLGALAFGTSSCGGSQAAAVNDARQGLVMRDIKYPMRDMRFPSGLRVLAEADSRSPVVALVLVVGAGSSSDPVGKEGLAHYIEHLAFRSRPFGKESVAKMLDKSGAGQWNAFTGFDSTVYFEMGPKESLGTLLQLEGNRMANPVARLAPETLPVELNVVRNELRQRGETGFAGEMFASMQSLLFPTSHPYARSVGGTHSSLSNITVDDVTAFLGKHYRPDNMTLLIIGDVDLQSIGTLVEQSLPKQLLEGPGQKPVASRLPPVAPAPPEPPPSTLTTKEAAVATPELWVGWSLPRAFDTDAYLVEFVNSAVGSALWQAEREDEDIAFINTFVVDGKDASMLLCQVGLTRGGHPEKSYQHILNALSRVWSPRNSTTALKLDEIAVRQLQRQALVRMVLEAEDLPTRGISRATTTHFTGDPTLYSRSMRNVMTLEPGQIAAFAQKYVNRDRARGMFFRPPKGGGALPESSALNAPTMEEEERRPVRADVERLRTILPGLGASGFTSLTLDNGLNVVLAERPGLPIVSARLLIQGGVKAADDLGAAYAGAWLQNPNTTWHGEPRDVGARFRENVGDDALTYSITGSSGNTDIILAMLAERTQSMSVDTEVWNRFERDRVPYMQAAETQPEEIADREFLSALFGTNPYGRSLTADKFKNINAGKAQDWIDATHVPNNAILVVVGEIDRLKTEAAIREFFGKWKRGAQVINSVESVSPGKKPATEPRLVATHRPDATQAQIRFGCLLPSVPDRGTDARHDIGAALLSARIGDLLRQQSGVTYGIYANARLLRGGTSYLDIRGAVENGQLASSLTTIKAALEKLGQTPADAQELARLKLKLARQRSTQFLSNDDIASAIVGARNVGFPLTSLDDEAKHYADVTPDQIQEDLAACLAGRPTLSIVGDEPAVRAAFQQGWVNAPASAPAASPAPAPTPVPAPTPAPAKSN